MMNMETLERTTSTHTARLPRVPRSVRTEKEAPAIEEDFSSIEDDLTPEEKAYWLASIERDQKNPNRGKVHRSIEELHKKMIAALDDCYERVQS